MVQGTPVKFLCDSGASRTTMKQLVPHTGRSSEKVYVRSAQGAVVQVPLSHPLWIRDPEGQSRQMPVIVLPQCPVNLLGRDGLLALGLSIIPTTKGLKVTRGEVCEPPNSAYLLGTDAPPEPKYVYALDVQNETPNLFGSRLYDLGGRGSRYDNDHVKTEDLHITMWKCHELDQKYGDKLYEASPVEATVTWLYEDIEGRTAAAVQLPEEAQKLYREGGAPYIALSKLRTDHWSVLSDLAVRGEAARDWRSTGIDTWWSEDAKLSKKALFWSKVSTWSGIHSTELDD